ncbi:MAG: hypothetical protein JXR22_07430 [Prolixibacteraceae bacterium]|nr:hypothetical protein [Prolixibacteraceae bacterium]
MLKNWILFILLFSTLAVSGQYYNGGQDRAALKWKKIDSQNFEVIFPEGFEKQAEKVVQLLEKSYTVTTKTLNHQPKHISVVLHTETVKSNAFLGWAPSRIEMFTTPHQGIYAQDWLEQLAIHEYRHMVQLSKLESEMPRLLRILFGEQAAAMLTAMYLPFWFIEGDAVAVETGLSTSGRGRLPEFHRELRAQTLEKGIFSYDKAYLGSYNDHVANHYQMGYFLVGGTRAMFSDSVWSDVLQHVAQKPFSLNAFDRGLKKTIGKKKVALYDTVFQTFQTEWMKQDQLIEPSPNQVLSPVPNVYTDYRFVYPLTDSTYFAEKISMDDVDHFVIIDQRGLEKKIFTPGYHFEESVGVRKHQLAWVERMPHVRWFHADYSLLRIFDLEQKTLREFKMRTKLFAPSFSPDMKHLAVIEADELYQFFLTIIDAETGKIVKRIKTPDNDFLITPSWSSQMHEVLLVALRNNQKGILKINTENQQIDVVLPFGHYEIKRPVQQDDHIYFIAGFEGIDHIYRVNSEGLCERVIQSRFGIGDHAYRSGNVYYSNYTANGFQFVMSCLDSLNIEKVNLNNVEMPFPLAEILTEQEGGPAIFNERETGNYRLEPYNKGQNLFNIHSWAPLAIQPSTYSVYPGVSLMSQNMLSTSELTAGYRYRWQDEQGEFYMNYTYLGWLPLIEVETSTGSRDSYYYELIHYRDANNQLIQVDTLQKDFKWRESNFLLRASLPINLSKGKHYRRLQPRLKYQFSNIAADERAHANFPKGNYQSLEAGLYYHHLLQTAAQDIQPDFGFMIDMSYNSSLAGVINFGSLFAVSNLIYLPGIQKNHGITVYNGYQSKSDTEYGFSDRIRFPRGHQHIMNKQMYSGGIDYERPVWYPDKQLLGLIYLKRMRLKGFYDQSWYRGSSTIDQEQFPYSGTLRSTGVEIAFDSHLFRFIAPVELGFRTSYLFNQQFKFDFLFNITFTL